MAEVVHDLLEESIRKELRQGHTDQAATLAIKEFGPGLLSFLYGVLAEEHAAHDVFSVFSEDLWKGIGSFRWECSFRTWLYCLARNAAHRYRRSPSRGQPLSSSLPLELVQEVRSQTRPWIRSEIKSRLRKLREQLDPEDKMVLILRIDRRMSWEDVARVLSEDAGSLSTQAVAKKATALRQQFQRVKVRLRELALEQGLISADE